jgi:hypothetical protein
MEGQVTFLSKFDVILYIFMFFLIYIFENHINNYQIVIFNAKGKKNNVVLIYFQYWTLENHLSIMI